MHLSVRCPHAASTRVDAEVTDLEGAGDGRRRPELGGTVDPPQQRADPRDELAHAERLGQVVVRADAQPDQDVGLVVASRQHQHRHRAHRLDPAAHLVPVEPGQHHVEHDQVRLVLGKGLYGGRPVVGLRDVVPLRRQTVAHGPVDHGLVLDHEDPAGRVGHVSERRSARPSEAGTTREDPVQVGGGWCWLRCERSVAPAAARGASARR